MERRVPQALDDDLTIAAAQLLQEPFHAEVPEEFVPRRSSVSPSVYSGALAACACRPGSWRRCDQRPRWSAEQRHRRRAIARAALRGPGLPEACSMVPSGELRLLTDHRADVVLAPAATLVRLDQAVAE